MEELFKDLSKFARENHKALKPAKQWLNDFDGDLDDAWEVATTELPIDWRKIVLIVSSTLDEGEAFLLNTILSGTYTTKIHPSLRIIQNALEKGRKTVAGSLNDTSNIVLSDEEQSVLEELAGRPGEKLTIRRLSKTLKTSESTIRDRVNRLKKMGLADKMEGRHGFFATDTGIEWYNIRWNK